MCEPFILEQTGLCVGDHQDMTTKNYRLPLDGGTGVYIMPVLQGLLQGYREHVGVYGRSLQDGAWCGLGVFASDQIRCGPDLVRPKCHKVSGMIWKLHGFG